MVKELRQLKKQQAAAPSAEGITVDQLLAQAEAMDGVSVIVAQLPRTPIPALRQLIDQLRKKAAPVAALLASPQEEGKLTLIAGLSRDLVEKGLDAVQWIQAVAPLVQGGGGGRPDMAQAGGKDSTHLAQALDVARTTIRRFLAG